MDDVEPQEFRLKVSRFRVWLILQTLHDPEYLLQQPWNDGNGALMYTGDTGHGEFFSTDSQ